MQRLRYRYDPLLNIDVDDTEPEYVSNEREWRNYTRANRVSKTSTKEDETDAFQVKGARTPIRCWELHKLKRGDHIGWHRSYVIWHHAIVVDKDIQNRRLLVIHYYKVKGVVNIVKEWIDVEKQNGEMFRFDYSADVMENNPRELVIKRAHRLLGRKHYGFFKNNCEHFATYCKTGKKESVQVKWAVGKLKETAMTSAVNVGKSAVKLGCNVATEVSKQSYKSIAEGTGKVAAAEGIETLGKASNWVGAGLIVGLETAHCAYDIYRLQKNRGEMTRRDFNATVTQRVSEGVFGSAGAIVGSLFGGFVGSCIPVLGTAFGTFVGSAVGGAIGSIVGKAVGSLFGGWLGGWLGKKFWS